MKAKKLRITISDYVLATKMADREAEIQEHGKPVSFKRVHKSRKVYDRKRMKAGDKKNLPSFFFGPCVRCASVGLLQKTDT